MSTSQEENDKRILKEIEESLALSLKSRKNKKELNCVSPYGDIKVRKKLDQNVSIKSPVLSSRSSQPNVLVCMINFVLLKVL